ncbi:glycosyltransferase [Pseudomonas knackmussii]|uniref:Glycosyltransferase n=1 Tax=Pseudomonas knackmussii TaxID=65741 RepID=A0ABY4KPM1_9PSED|nr:glycosyltransferase [Pseudomonas knackmussii]UPQ81325.1 glycosyltransferase [Pseudomonas knackmussii]
MFTVLMSVYEKEFHGFLSLALESVWDSQCAKPSQIVLVQDGPLTVELNKEIRKWKGKLGEVLTIVSLPKNVGLASALNEGLQCCDYDLIARMDSDDIAESIRFSKQIQFMLANPEISVCSGQVEEWSQDFSYKISTRNLPLRHDDILKFAKSRSPISHPAVMFRKSAVMAVGGYPNIYPEDYPLWGTLIANGYKFANLPDVLLKMRVGNALAERRGKRFLQGEIEIYKHLYAVGLINRFELVGNIALRSIVRLSPVRVKRFLYKYFR